MFWTTTKEIFYQNGVIDLKQNALINKRSRYSSLDLLENEHTLLASTSNMNIVTALDNELKTIELELISYTGSHYKEQSTLLQHIDGIGPIISMTIMYDVDDISRFKRRQDFTSYCRFAKPFHYSDGKVVGIGNAKCGNPYLKRAFMEIVSNAIGHCPEVAQIHAELKTKYKPLQARALLANRYCTAVYHMLKKNESFDLKKFCNIPEVVQPVLVAGTK